MFTGIITHHGLIRARSGAGDVTLVIAVPPGFTDGLALGASVACSGACLTVTAHGPDSFTVLAAAETLRCTNVGRWREGDRINVERALTLGAELGGHLVTGHVDGLATLSALHTEEGSWHMTFLAPESLKRYIAAKGSATLDGVSLTVNAVEDAAFAVLVIPHTLAHTTLGTLAVGDTAHLEIDLIARYVERLRTA